MPITGSLIAKSSQVKTSPPCAYSPVLLSLGLQLFSHPLKNAVVVLVQLNSLLLVAIDVVCSVRGTGSTSDGDPLYFFFEGRWSLPSSLLFVVVVYHIR